MMFVGIVVAMIVPRICCAMRMVGLCWSVHARISCRATRHCIVAYMHGFQRTIRRMHCVLCGDTVWLYSMVHHFGVKSARFAPPNDLCVKADEKEMVVNWSTKKKQQQVVS